MRAHERTRAIFVLPRTIARYGMSALSQANQSFNAPLWKLRRRHPARAIFAGTIRHPAASA
jgi:hypothetical protein